MANQVYNQGRPWCAEGVGRNISQLPHPFVALGIKLVIPSL